MSDGTERTADRRSRRGGGAMKLLVVGAGPIGCLYAGRLALAGHSVELVARGDRLATLARQGLRLVDAATGTESRPDVRVVAAGEPAATYDAVLIAVRAEQLATTLPALASLNAVSPLVTLVNQPDGGDAAAAAVGRARLVLGFPGATGSLRADGAVVCSIVPGWAQKTTFGESAGGVGPRVRALVEACRGAGFPTVGCTNMPAWLRTHAAFIAPLGVPLAFLAGGDPRALAADRGARVLLVDGVLEGLTALRATGGVLVPRRFGWLARAPRGLLLGALPSLLRSRLFAGWAGGHAAVSAAEMRMLLSATVARARAAGRPCPATEALLAEVLKF